MPDLDIGCIILDGRSLLAVADERSEGYWTVKVLMAETLEDYKYKRIHIARLSKNEPLGMGERRITAVVYLPEHELEVTGKSYHQYVWMLSNILMPLRDNAHENVKFHFDMDDLFLRISKYVPDVLRWDQLRKDGTLFGVYVKDDKGDRKLYQTKCASYDKAQRYIEENFVGTVLMTIFPSENSNTYHLSRAWFENEADATVFDMMPVSKWYHILGDRQ